MTQAAPDAFTLRHIGPRPEDRDRMLHALGVPTLDALIDQVVPSHIRRSEPLVEPPAETEPAFLGRLRTLEARNGRFRSFIGAGYYNTHTPAVIQRMVLENPGWYTPYTPYQAEIAQGRLEALLTFQTAVSDLTGMDVANASLLDEATAAAEAMTLLRRVSKKPASALRFLVIGEVFPQVRELLVSRAEPLGLQVEFGAEGTAIGPEVFGVLVQYPDGHGLVTDIGPLIARAHDAGALVAVGSDLLALTTLVPPGELGADVVYGSAQRFGVPLGYGGPHAAFFATRDAYVRQSPGRIIGVSVDAQGGSAYRMALQTREQHIRREKATSNICTAQALLANIAAFYAVFHGAEGLTDIAGRVHGLAVRLTAALSAMGLTQHNAAYFDTVRVSGVDPGILRAAAEAAQINFRYLADGSIGIALDETTTADDVLAIANVFGKVVGRGTQFDEHAASPLTAELRRTSSFLAHPVFTEHRSELQITRFIRRLERARHRPRHVDDPARLLHDEAQCSCRDAANHVAGLCVAAPVRAGGAGRRLPGDLPRPRAHPVRHHRLCRRLAAAQLGGARRAGRADGHPCLSPGPWRRPSHRGVDSLLRARHQSGKCRDGRHEGGGGRL